MRRLAWLLTSTALTFAAPRISAQPKPEAAAPDQPKEDEEDKPEPEAKPPEESSSAAETKPKPAPEAKKDDAGSLPEGDDETPPEPPLPPPRSDEQEPRPVFHANEPDKPRRLVLVGPDLGLTLRNADGSGASYSPGLSWGAHVRAELLPFLGFRAWFTQTQHSVDVSGADLGLPGHDVDQDPLTIAIIGARLEPTWTVTPRLRLWLGLGVGWNRVNAPIATITPEVVVAKRKGVFLEWSAALGGSYEVVKDWLAVSLMLSGGFTSNQSGNVFDSVQGIDQTGSKVTVGGYPEIESTASALLGVDVIL